MSDTPARERARTIFDHPLVVEAGAGTGKTTTLIARITTWCVGPGWERAAKEMREDPRVLNAADRIAARTLDGVVAITFTEAAAAEMAARFGAALVELAAGRDVVGVPELPVPDEEAQRRARALLGAVDRLVVSTIHAFCARVLASAPTEAGLHPAHRVDADGALLADVVHEVVVDWFTEVFGSEAPLVQSGRSLLLLAERGVGSEEVVDALTQLASNAIPPSSLGEEVYTTAAIRALLQRVRRTVAAWSGPVRDSVHGAPKPAEKLEATRDAVRALAEVAKGPADLATVHKLFRLANDFSDEHLKDLAAGRFTRQEERLFGPQRDTIALASGAVLRVIYHLGCQDSALVDAGREVLQPLLERVHAELRRRGVVSFSQLLRGARDLLRSDARLRARFREGMTQLLVDEFQDTDALQCELVRMLALEGEQRPGLFLVGDPKQSIYGWRSADLVAYQGFVDDVCLLGGERLLLDVNRRSLPPILEEVARCVAPVMQFEAGYQALFQPLVPWRVGDAPPPAPWAPVEHWISGRFDGENFVKMNAEDVAKLEGAAIAADLLRLRATGLDWDKAALLLRSSGDLDHYVSALREAGVPYAVERNLQYFRKREIIEAAALVRCILEPEDTLALLTVLRSALVGAPDAALLPLWRDQLPMKMAALVEPDPDALAELGAIAASAARVAAASGAAGVERVEGWERLFVVTVEAIAWLRANVESLPVDTFVTELRERLPMEILASARHLGEYRLANLQRFYTELTEALSRGDPQAVVRALRAGVSGGREAEEARPTDGGERAVRIMTIHKSKGLDFDHVYVLQTHKGRRGGRPDRRDTKVSEIDGGWEYQLFGARTPGWDRVVEHEDRVESNERVRLLYVAMTRARDRLVLLGTWQDVTAIVPVERAGNLLQLLSARPDVPSAAMVARQGPLHASGALWRVCDVGAGAKGHGAEREWSGLADPDAEQRRRDWARQRMARPTSSAASAAAHAELEVGEPAVQGSGGGSKEGAAVVGTAVHRALELMDPSRPPGVALAAAIEVAHGVIAAALFGVERDRARARAEALLTLFVGGALGARLRALKNHVISRELRMFSAGDDGDAPTLVPVGYIEGAIDMVYRDPASQEVVVVDYKTDAVATVEQRDARTSVYSRQTQVYVSAVQAALGLPDPPRAELWFLARDEAVVVAR